MPVYNASKYLAEAIDSIIDQTYTDWELIIVNDGSTDESEAIIKNYKNPRIKYYANERNEGLIYTLNRAIALCKGEYIARMDADDVSLPERLQLQYTFLSNRPKYAMCGSNASIIDERGNITGHIINFKSDIYLKINLLFSVPFVHPTVMIRTDVLRKNLYDIKNKHAEDYELWCRISDNFKIANLDKNLLRYRWHETNVSVINSVTQDKAKNLIISNQLKKIGLDATEEDLFLHKVTFLQYSAKDTLAEKMHFDDYYALGRWFSKIITANKKTMKYDSSALISYLWSRWIVLCFAQKKITRIFKPEFVPFSFDIFIKTFKLIMFYGRK